MRGLNLRFYPGYSVFLYPLLIKNKNNISKFLFDEGCGKRRTLGGFPYVNASSKEI